jgi:hypothetical protein
MLMSFSIRLAKVRTEVVVDVYDDHLEIIDPPPGGLSPEAREAIELEGHAQYRQLEEDIAEEREQARRDWEIYQEHGPVGRPW